jgi:uncharacterized protein
MSSYDLINYFVKIYGALFNDLWFQLTELFYITFPISGVKTLIFTPSLIAFVVSFIASIGGISGAFILLPFQISVLNYNAPSVSGTNHLFNIFAVPTGIWQYIKEKRMVWPLTWIVIIGTLPGILLGTWIRLVYLPNPKNFKLFAATVLLYIGVKMFTDFRRDKKALAESKNDPPVDFATDFIVTETRFSLKKVEFKFSGQYFSFPVLKVSLLCFVVGIIGGIYGIGGGAIAPFFVTIFKLPVYAVAGASLMGTFVTSLAAVILFQILAFFYSNASAAPDWHLGFCFGLGGLFGIYFGTKFQKYIPAYIIKFILFVFVMFVSIKYFIDFFI